MPAFTVLISGAGLGGLTLAQSLRRAGIDVRLYERDDGPFDRRQGDRLHLDADALNAVREVLPPDLLAAFEATSYRTEPYTTILRTDLTVARRILTDDDHGARVWPAHQGPPEHANVDRATLRQILLAGLEDRVQYGKALLRYESDAEGVTAHFADGTTARGDVLVGADGIGSPVRGQRAPHAERADAGITAIYGRVPLQAAAALAPREVMTDIFAVATDERKIFLGLGAVRFPTRPEQAFARRVRGTIVRPAQDYVVCVIGGRHEHFPDLHCAAPGAELQDRAALMLAPWPGPAARIVRAGDPSSFFLIEMSTSVPCALDAPTRITLLGDAIHAMTPTLGRGANLAMRDGTLLGRALASVAAGHVPLPEALAEYEREMLRTGFSVVREAAEIGRQRMAQNPLPA